MSKKFEKNNYQDDAEVKEYDKGKRAGQQSKRSGSKKHGSSRRSGRRTGGKPGNGSKFGGGQRFEPRAVPVDTGAKADNDVGWYTISNQIVKDVTSLPVLIQNGLPVERKYDFSNLAIDKSAVRYYDFFEQMPGVMTLEFAPTFGADTGATSPLNMSINSLFAFIAKDQLGSVKASACDFGIYTLAMDSALMMYSWMCRLYGIAMNGYSATDMYTPEALLHAQGILYSDFVTKLPQFRTMLNLFAFNMQAMKVPTGLTYNTRHIWMCEHIYTDAPSSRAQYYMYVPHGFYVYSETNLNPQTGPFTNNLTYKQLSSYKSNGSYFTLEDLQQILDDILRPIWGSQDCKRMSSQVLRAFGNNTVPINPIAENYTVSPAYSKEVLSQIENAYIWVSSVSDKPVSGDADEQQIVQASLTQHVSDLTVGEYLVPCITITRDEVLTGTTFSPNFKGKNPAQLPLAIAGVLMKDNIILNYHMDTVTDSEVLISTRVAYTKPEVVGIKQYLEETPNDFASVKLKITDPGSEVIIRGKITYYEPAARNVRQSNLVSRTFASDNFLFPINRELTGSNYSSTMRHLLVMSSIVEKFDWHPLYAFVQMEGESASGDFNNYDSLVIRMPLYNYDLDTIIETDTQYIANINNAALLKMFQPDGMAGYGIKA